MTKLPTALQLQIGEAVTIIADADFPQKWETLIEDLVSNITLTDLKVTNGVLQTAHSIFKRWRAQFRSDALFTEIKFVLTRFCDPFLALFVQVDAIIQQNSTNKQVLELALESMTLLCKLFFDLNSQDIPEFFEDHMTEFMSILHRYLQYENILVDPADESETTGPLQKLKACVCEIVELYTQRYEEIFTMLPEFVSTTWTLLSRISLEPKNDILASKALSFLTCVVRIQRHAQLFEADNVLDKFVELIILPNMSLRESDMELFEDDPIEFIRRDLEGSDNDTRRRAATEFVRALVQRFEQQVTTIVLRYVTHYLQQFSSNPTQNWLAKDTAMYLISSVAVKGVVTKSGVTSTNLMIDVVDFYNSNVLPDLQAADHHPILKVDAIKFIHTFRNQLTRQQLIGTFPILAQQLSSNNYVVYTYASVTVDALLVVRRDDQLLFTKNDIASILPQLLSNLLSLIERGSTPEKLAENDFLIRCVMRVLAAAQEKSANEVTMVIEHLNKILREISKNPSNPRFNHYLFECYGSIIRYVGVSSSSAIGQIESMIIGPFLSLLQNDITEFIPYVFQLLAQMLELRPGATLPETYQQLTRPILTPSLWDSRGNVPPLVRLMQAFLQRGPEHFVSNGLLEPVLGVFQKLISSKANDNYGFDLIETLYRYIPSTALANYNQQIFVLLLTRLNNSRTEKYTLRFCVFTYYLSALEQTGPNFVIDIMQAIQPGMFSQIMNSLVMPNTQKILMPGDTKTTAIGLTNYLKSSLVNDPTLWSAMLTTQLKFLELPAQDSKGDGDLLNIDLEDGFQASFSSLRMAGRTSTDPWQSIADPKQYFVDTLKQGQSSGFGPLLSSLPGDVQSVLRNYGVQI